MKTQKVLAFILALFMASIALADQVTLQWDPNNPNPDGYRLYQRTTGGTYDYTKPIIPDGLSSSNIPAATTTVTIKNLTTADGTKTKYLWVVRAYQGSDQSGDSNEVEYVVDRVPPMAVSDLAASYNPATGEITLNWTQPGTEPAAYWKVFSSDTAGGPYTEFDRVNNAGQSNTGTSTKTLTVQAGQMQTFYFVVVSFKNDTLYSTNGNEVSQVVDKRALAPIQTLKITVKVIN